MEEHELPKMPRKVKKSKAQKKEEKKQRSASRSKSKAKSKSKSKSPKKKDKKDKKDKNDKKDKKNKKNDEIIPKDEYDDDTDFDVTDPESEIEDINDFTERVPVRIPIEVLTKKQLNMLKMAETNTKPQKFSITL